MQAGEGRNVKGERGAAAAQRGERRGGRKTRVGGGRTNTKTRGRRAYRICTSTRSYTFPAFVRNGIVVEADSVNENEMMSSLTHTRPDAFALTRYTVVRWRWRWRTSMVSSLSSVHTYCGWVEKAPPVQPTTTKHCYRNESQGEYHVSRKSTSQHLPPSLPPFLSSARLTRALTLSSIAR